MCVSRAFLEPKIFPQISHIITPSSAWRSRCRSYAMRVTNVLLHVSHLWTSEMWTNFLWFHNVPRLLNFSPHSLHSTGSLASISLWACIWAAKLFFFSNLEKFLKFSKKTPKINKIWKLLTRVHKCRRFSVQAFRHRPPSSESVSSYCAAALNA